MTGDRFILVIQVGATGAQGITVIDALLLPLRRTENHLFIPSARYRTRDSSPKACTGLAGERRGVDGR